MTSAEQERAAVVGRYLSACQYEPAPYTCLIGRLNTLVRAHAKEAGLG